MSKWMRLLLNKGSNLKWQFTIQSMEFKEQKCNIKNKSEIKSNISQLK